MDAFSGPVTALKPLAAGALLGDAVRGARRESWTRAAFSFLMPGSRRGGCATPGRYLEVMIAFAHRRSAGSFKVKAEMNRALAV